MPSWCRNGLGKTPPLFINQLVHVILRNALDGVDDPRVLRAAEMFFRTQRVTLHDGSLIAADEETIGGVNTAPVSPLVSMLGIPAEAEIDVINDDNAESYWERSDRFDMALDLTAGRDGPRGAGARRCGAGSRICSASRSPSSRSPSCASRRSPGMSGSTPTPPGSATMLWNGEDIDEATMARVVGLFQLDLPRSGDRARQGAEASRSI